jgi:nucleotide-binding universal stress UspA family protein
VETISPLTVHHMVLPLDGSRLAEAALPAGIALAARLQARVTLLHVLERHPPATVHGERHLTNVEEAAAYLRGVSSRFADHQIAIESHVHPSPEGDVPVSIAQHVEELNTDLVVLCTHGHGGIRGWFSGSIAQRVVRRTTPPTLLVRPSRSDQPGFEPRTVMVALDGTEEGEAVLPAALALALAFDASISLFYAVPTLATVPGDKAAAARLTPSATAAALDLEQASAVEYVDHLGERLERSGVTVEGEVGRGSAAERLIAASERFPDSVVALATHGRAGFDAVWSGSVGAKVVTKASGPLLLVHP